VKSHPDRSFAALLLFISAAVTIAPACEPDSGGGANIAITGMDAGVTIPDAAPPLPGCSIGSGAANVGDLDPANACRRCEGSPDARQWTTLADGSACSAGRVCASGTCEARCFIGGALHAASTPNPTAPCQSCEPTVSTTAWTPRASGASCEAGKVCESGTCAAKCFIGGTFYADGAPNPGNDCEACTPATSTTAWSPRPSVPLLTGGTDIVAQGWTTVSQDPNTVTYGPDYVRLATSTVEGARTSGQLLLVRSMAVDPTKPFKLQVELQVESVNNHNQLDSAAAILGSFTSPAGNGTDRSQMIYLDNAAIGWSDDTQSAAFTVVDGAYHTYELSVDAAKVATVSIDGVAKLTRNNFTSNGTIAIGDQTNDPRVDGVMRIRAVHRMCP